MSAIFPATSARVPAATASGRRFGLQWVSTSAASVTASAAQPAICPGTSIVF
jgi:hypothetical protein